MYHTLKTLYQQIQEHAPSIMRNFEKLEAYCMDNTNLPRGKNSLKWLIYKLRDTLTGNEIERLFYKVCIESLYRGESNLYYRIFQLPSAKQYENQIQHSVIDWTRFPVLKSGNWRVLINESEQNITSLAFKQDRCDIIVFRNPTLDSAGIVFRVERNSVVDYFDVDWLFKEIQERNPSEKWVILDGLIICGGPKHPKHKTIVSVEVLFSLLAWSRRNFHDSQ